MAFFEGIWYALLPCLFHFFFPTQIAFQNGPSEATLSVESEIRHKMCPLEIQRIEIVHSRPKGVLGTCRLIWESTLRRSAYLPSGRKRGFFLLQKERGLPELKQGTYALWLDGEPHGTIEVYE